MLALRIYLLWYTNVGFPTELCCNIISYYVRNYIQVTCFTTFYHLDSYSFLRLIIFNTLVCLFLVTRHA